MHLSRRREMRHLLCPKIFSYKHFQAQWLYWQFLKSSLDNLKSGNYDSWFMQYLWGLSQYLQGSFISQMEWALCKSLFWKNNERCFFVRQTFLLKYINLWQRQHTPKTYDNIKLDFLWLQSSYWLLLQTLTWSEK